MYISYLCIVHLKCFRKVVAEKQWIKCWFEAISQLQTQVLRCEVSSYARPRLCWLLYQLGL